MGHTRPERGRRHVRLHDFRDEAAIKISHVRGYRPRQLLSRPAPSFKLRVMPTACRIAVLIAACAASIWGAPAVAREKSDIVVLANGDRLTGEITELAYGHLSLKTESLGTVAIEWPDVARVESRYTFTVEANDGRRYNGSIGPGSSGGRLLVIGAVGPIEIGVTDVARISQLESGLVDRVDFSVSFGFDTTHSTDVSTLKIGFDGSYRSEKLYSRLEGDLKLTDTPEQGRLDQYEITNLNEFLRPGDLYWLAVGSYESNEQQGIDGRLLLGAARGRYWLRRSDTELSTYLGAAFVQEWATSSADDASSAEALVGMQWRVFRFRDPETSLTSRFVVLPGLTETGRYRAKSSISLRHEIIKDLFFDLSFDGSYDSDPPVEDADSLDYSLSTSLGYKF
jgi:hypothetical protein